MGGDTLECIHCGKLKNRSEFFTNFRMKEGVESKCKACAAAYQRQNRKKKWERLFEYAGSACQHCGISDVNRPEIYEFHHINPAEKEYQIAGLMRCKWERLIAEADKCIMLCANCHKTEHKRLRDEQQENG